jgi:TetR/AcrR family transcriptional regulator, mexJK operon transcriptional repressor
MHVAKQPWRGTQGSNLSEQTGPAKLLVKAALEAVLAKASNRLDAKARTERMKAAALMECAEVGYAGLTVANIAKRAKVSTSSIYAEYPDRDKLLVAAMEMLFGLLAADVIEVPEADDPQTRVEQLLIAHGQVYAQPLTIWFFRLHATLVWAGHDHLRDLGLFVFRGIDAFWAKFLAELESQGHLTGIDPDLVVPWLLGPIERCTIISRLSCGEDDPDRPSLAAAAHFGSAMLFQIWGRGATRPGPGARDDEDEEAAELLTCLEPFATFPDEPQTSSKQGRNTPQAQRAGILRAAKTACHTQGYEFSNVRDIAAAAGVSTATLYEHFPDKTGLFIAAAEEEFALNVRYRKDTGPIALDAALLLIASRAADLNWVWMYNVMMASTISENPRIVALGRKHRGVTEAFLDEAAGHRRDALEINFLLGAIERSGAMALILFGPSAVDMPNLAKLAAFTARSFEGDERQMAGHA